MVQRVCPASAQCRVFTCFPHPVLTLAVLSCSFCTQRMNSGGGVGGVGTTPHPQCPGGNRKQTLRRALESPSPVPCELHCLGAVRLSLAINTTFEAHWIHCTGPSA